MFDALIKYAGDDIGMHLHPGVNVLYGRGAQVEQAWCRGTEQNDSVFQDCWISCPVEYLIGRHVGETAGESTIRHVDSPRFVYRNTVLIEVDRFEGEIVLAVFLAVRLDDEL